MDYIPPTSYFEYLINHEEIDVESIKEQAFEFMDQLQGWCSHQKASILIDLVFSTQPKRIVEIGVWGGKSMIPMACALRAIGSGIIYGIDSWDKMASTEGVMDETNKNWWEKVDHDTVMYHLVKKINAFGLDNQTILIKNTSETAPLIDAIDILHIDGNHSDETSFSDVQKWVPLVRKGGVIIFNDMTWFENGIYTTSRAVEWLNTNCTKIKIFNDNCIWGIWEKP